ncbi:hypothetical protein [Saccharopolyspora pogona]|uniref:hypothetical protein n=1 Tax=Saccharopolyspora pogona TaxID=333966 RepID=UPI001686A81B|nr:hypothetical protein [Saccharopolyspora pogona]
MVVQGHPLGRVVDRRPILAQPIVALRRTAHALLVDNPAKSPHDAQKAFAQWGFFILFVLVVGG